jgi:large subunit ribosomal protein L4
MKLTVASTVGQNSTLAVRDDVFGVALNAQLVAQAIRVYLANQRQGTSKVKTRSEISRTKKKWFKQKGTGNARHGARTPSLFVGGGVAHGPTGMQNWSLKFSASMRRSALVSALSAQAPKTIVCEDLTQLDGKTSSAAKLFQKMLPSANRILVVLPQPMPMVMRSLRNLENVFVTYAGKLTTYEVAYADALVLTKESVKMLEMRLGKVEKSSEKAVKEPKVLKEKAEETVVKPVAKKSVVKVATKKVVEKTPVKKKVAVKKAAK